MSRYRLTPTPTQEISLAQHGAHARYVWNLAVEQQSWWRRGRGNAPGYCTQAAQLTEARAEDKAPRRVEKIKPTFTSQRCSARGHVAADSRKSQALFRCAACGYIGNADVNAARNVATGHAVSARGRSSLGERKNREPQPLSLSA
jgi:putative transposase